MVVPLPYVIDGVPYGGNISDLNMEDIGNNVHSEGCRFGRTYGKLGFKRSDSDHNQKSKSERIQFNFLKTNQGWYERAPAGIWAYQSLPVHGGWIPERSQRIRTRRRWPYGQTGNFKCREQHTYSRQTLCQHLQQTRRPAFHPRWENGCRRLYHWFGMLAIWTGLTRPHAKDNVRNTSSRIGCYKQERLLLHSILMRTDIWRFRVWPSDRTHGCQHQTCEMVTPAWASTPHIRSSRTRQTVSGTGSSSYSNPSLFLPLYGLPFIRYTALYGNRNGIWLMPEPPYRWIRGDYVLDLCRKPAMGRRKLYHLRPERKPLRRS